VWLAVGALVGIGVLIAAGMYIPRHVGTHADANKPMFPSKDSGNNANSSATKDANGTSNTNGVAADNSKPLVSLQGDQGSLKVGADGSVSLEGPNGSMHVDAKTGAVSMSDKPAGKAQKNMANGNPTPSREQTSPAVQTPATPETPAAPSPEEIEKVQDQADKLNIRAQTATQSLETLRQQQMASGYNLRSDIASAEQRMQMYLGKGNDALKAQDLTNAQKYFDKADAECTKIEKFLGH
jgi:hypothetical protein